MKKLIYILICVLPVAFFASFRTQLYIPGVAHEQYLSTTDQTLTINQLSEGRALYISACGGCHYLHYPDQYTIAEWQKIYPEMRTRVKLTDQDLEKVYQYLITGASDSPVKK